MICHPKKSEGLGIINLQTQSDALMLKYLHKFYNHHDIPWVELIWTTYYDNKFPHATDPCRSFWWRDVIKLTPIYRGISFVTIASGDKVLMWKDLWLNDVLADTHSRAFSLEKDQDISVRDFLLATSLEETFHLPLSIQAHDEIRNMQ